jgi:hypothetical protein
MLHDSALTFRRTSTPLRYVSSVLLHTLPHAWGFLHWAGIEVWTHKISCTVHYSMELYWETCFTGDMGGKMALSLASALNYVWRNTFPSH